MTTPNNGFEKVDTALDLEAMDEYLRSVAKPYLSVEEIRAQRISFVMGMLPEKSTTTREQVEEILRRSYG